MAWYLARVGTDYREEGYAIFDSVCGAIVRPLVGHPQSVFPESLATAIANYLTTKYGDPRKAEHKLTDEELKVLIASCPAEEAA